MGIFNRKPEKLTVREIKVGQVILREALSINAQFVRTPIVGTSPEPQADASTRVVFRLEEEIAAGEVLLARMREGGAAQGKGTAKSFRSGVALAELIIAYPLDGVGQNE